MVRVSCPDTAGRSCVELNRLRRACTVLQSGSHQPLSKRRGVAACAFCCCCSSFSTCVFVCVCVYVYVCVCVSACCIFCISSEDREYASWPVEEFREALDETDCPDCQLSSSGATVVVCIQSERNESLKPALPWVRGGSESSAALLCGCFPLRMLSS